MTKDDQAIITSDLAKFPSHALKEGAELLSQLSNSNISFESPLHLKTNTVSNETFLGNADIALVAGDNGHLHELEMDDYAREFQSDTELKFGENAEKFHQATILHRELVEYENIINDFTEAVIKGAVDELDEDQKAIVEVLDQLLELDIDPDIIDEDCITPLSDAYASLSNRLNTKVYETKDAILDTLNTLNVNLNN